jgi:glucosamine--fructose-6-phosphate aminotransferase (isomerizing)
VVAVTNNERSTLAQAAGSRVLLKAGAEATVSCKTYMATLAGLHLLGAALEGSEMGNALTELRQAEAAVRDYLSNWREHVSELATVVDGIKVVFVTGRGSSLAAAGTGGLILKESTRQPAEGMSSAAFRHGPLEMADQRALVLVFEGDQEVAPLNQRLVADVTAAGGRAALISTRASGAFRLPNVPEEARSIVEILPVQMLSLAIAAREGVEAGRFMRATKITNIA